MELSTQSITTTFTVDANGNLHFLDLLTSNVMGRWEIIGVIYLR